MKRTDINIRDPFVLVKDGKYYMYGSRGETVWGLADGFDVYVSKDLEEFDGPYEVFHRPEHFMLIAKAFHILYFVMNGHKLLMAKYVIWNLAEI